MSISASEIKFVRSLQQKKFRKELGLFVIEGVKPVRELLSSSIEIDQILSTEPFDFLPDDFALISEKELQRISGLKSPNKLLAIARIPASNEIHWANQTMLLLDGINDPGNLGTIIRTARWFGVTDILCSPDCVDAYDRKVVQSTMGALFHVTVSYGNQLEFIEKAKNSGYSVLGTDMNGTSIFEVEKPTKTLLVIGSESHGMREDTKEKCDTLCSIPNVEAEQKVESLNAGVATGIVLAEICRRHLG